MFKFNIKSWWRGDATKARLIQERKVGIRALAEYVADKARVYCPYDASKPAGKLHLRETIQVISEADGLRHHVVATALYAEPVEFGHVMRNGRFYPPNPFLRKAVRDGAAAMPQFIGGSRIAQGFHHGQLMGATFE